MTREAGRIAAALRAEAIRRLREREAERRLAGGDAAQETAAEPGSLIRNERG